MKVKDMNITFVPVLFGKDEKLFPADFRKKEVPIPADNKEIPLIKQWIKEHLESDEKELITFIQGLRKSSTF